MAEQQNPENEGALPPILEFFNIAGGCMSTQAVYVAAKLGIADLLEDGPKNIGELSRATGADSQSLYRLLRALASIEFFVENDDGSFGLTPLATLLQSSNPMSLRPFALLAGDQLWWAPWGNLLHSIMTGETAFEHVYGMRFFEYLGRHPDAADAFNGWMTRMAQFNNPVLVASYDFSDFRSVVDVGGGEGSLLSAILKANPTLKGVLFDLPEVVKSAKGIEPEVAERCEIIGGDFFESIPTGGDAYILQQIIHDWDDDLSIRILQNCHRAMAENGRVLVIDSVISPGNAPDLNKFIDLHMLVLNHGGKERTEPEFRSLFNASGFELTNVIPTLSPFCIVEGIRR